MNYLAHAYLSFGEPGILAGNLFSDFVKGKKKFDYPATVQKGIMLHREIDTFTDSHAATREAKLFFKPVYGLYAGAFMDVVYDHFLANDKSIFPTSADLDRFSEQTYRQMALQEGIFPPKFEKVFHYMRLQNWLSNYRDRLLIYNSFRGLVYRAAYMQDHQPACNIFDANYDAFAQCYKVFFPELKHFVMEQLMITD